MHLVEHFIPLSIFRKHARRELAYKVYRTVQVCTKISTLPNKQTEVRLIQTRITISLSEVPHSCSGERQKPAEKTNAGHYPGDFFSNSESSPAFILL